MAPRYSTSITAYCEANGIVIPGGFHRLAASRYAIVREGSPPTLVARTWFNQADVVYYLQKIADSDIREILDFKDRFRLGYEGGGRLKKLEPFEVFAPSGTSTPTGGG